jgi:signal transduction histidine kinase
MPERPQESQTLETLAALVRSLAHDLNNTLGPVTGYADLLQRALLNDDKSRARVEAIRTSARRATELIETLRAVARIGQPELAPVAAAHLLADLSMRVGPFLRPGVTFTHSIQPGLPEFHADKRLLGEALLALAKNAIDALPPTGGAVTVTFDASHDGSAEPAVPTHIRIRVAPDHGPAENPGLTLAAAAARAHGGSLTLAPQPSGGTAATMLIPASPARSGAPPAPAL